MHICLFGGGRDNNRYIFPMEKKGINAHYFVAPRWCDKNDYYLGTKGKENGGYCGVEWDYGNRNERWCKCGGGSNELLWESSPLTGLNRWPKKAIMAPRMKFWICRFLLRPSKMLLYSKARGLSSYWWAFRVDDDDDTDDLHDDWHETERRRWHTTKAPLNEGCCCRCRLLIQAGTEKQKENNVVVVVVVRKLANHVSNNATWRPW